mmetsp:Transcript_34207/g.87683  ORF Transcript_34207/g.87683 Transcript_34207/m.87683 type:complete len:353 (+) Transcript_34207:657-1715(+)
MRLAEHPGRMQLGRRNVVEVGVIRGVDRRLRTREKQLLNGHTLRAHARPHCKAVVVIGNAIEVAAVPVLPWHRRHVDLHVDVRTLTRLVPPIHLKLDAHSQLHMHHVHRLASPAILQKGARAVVLRMHEARRITPLRVERLQDRQLLVLRRPVRRGQGANAQNVVAQQGTAHGDLHGHTEAAGDGQRLVLALDLQVLAPHDPVLARRVVVRMHAIESMNVRVTEDDAVLRRQRRRGGDQRGAMEPPEDRQDQQKRRDAHATGAQLPAVVRHDLLLLVRAAALADEVVRPRLVVGTVALANKVPRHARHGAIHFAAEGTRTTAGANHPGTTALSVLHNLRHLREGRTGHHPLG